MRLKLVVNEPTDASPTRYRAAHPDPAGYAIVPACVVRVYGRPQHRTFREDTSAGDP